MRSIGMSECKLLVLSTSLWSLSLVRWRSSCTASLFMPIARHFWYLQYWHRFLCRLSMMHDFSSRHAYDRSLRTVLLKKPLQPSQLRTTEEEIGVNGRLSSIFSLILVYSQRLKDLILMISRIFIRSCRLIKRYANAEETTINEREEGLIIIIINYIRESFTISWCIFYSTLTSFVVTVLD